jgi:hypothetical protein
VLVALVLFEAWLYGVPIPMMYMEGAWFGVFFDQSTSSLVVCRFESRGYVEVERL